MKLVLLLPRLTARDFVKPGGVAPRREKVSHPEVRE